jgi:hypothetical protein
VLAEQAHRALTLAVYREASSKGKDLLLKLACRRHRKVLDAEYRPPQALKISRPAAVAVCAPSGRIAIRLT